MLQRPGSVKRSEELTAPPHHPHSHPSLSFIFFRLMWPQSNTLVRAASIAPSTPASSSTPSFQWSLFTPLSSSFCAYHSLWVTMMNKMILVLSTCPPPLCSSRYWRHFRVTWSRCHHRVQFTKWEMGTYETQIKSILLQFAAPCGKSNIQMRCGTEPMPLGPHESYQGRKEFLAHTNKRWYKCTEDFHDEYTWGWHENLPQFDATQTCQKLNERRR